MTKMMGLFGLLLMLACGEAESTVNPNVFKYNQASGISSLDPAFAKNQANIWAVSQLFNGLVQLDQDLKVQPCIAKDWTISEDGMTFTFFLRDDVLFHDHNLFEQETSRRVTAFDFEYSFNRIIDPKTASSGAWVFNGKVAETGPFRAINDTTFQIQLAKPFLPMMSMLTMPYCYVVPQEIVEHYGKDFRAHPIGTGPFEFKVWEEGTALVAIKNEQYFEYENDLRLPYLDGFKVSFAENKKMEFLNFQQGKLDMISSIDKSLLSEMFDEYGDFDTAMVKDASLVRVPFLNTEYLGFNYTIEGAEYLADRNLRLAINLCFDRVEMIDYLRKGIGFSATGGFIPKGLPAFDDEKVKGYIFNPDSARSLIAKSEYNGEEIKLLTNDSYRDIALFISKACGEVGLNVSVEVLQPSILREWMTQGKADFFRGSWIADYPDAENYLTLFYSKNGAPPNYTRFSNQQYDDWYQQSLLENNDSLRISLYQQMDSLLLYEAPVVPLYYDEVIRLTKKNVKGLQPNPLNSLDLKTVQKM